MEEREKPEGIAQNEHNVYELVKQQNTMRYQIGFLVWGCVVVVWFTSTADVGAKSVFPNCLIYMISVVFKT